MSYRNNYDCSSDMYYDSNIPEGVKHLLFEEAVEKTFKLTRNNLDRFWDELWKELDKISLNTGLCFKDMF